MKSKRSIVCLTTCSFHSLRVVQLCWTTVILLISRYPTHFPISLFIGFLHIFVSILENLPHQRNILYRVTIYCVYTVTYTVKKYLIILLHMNSIYYLTCFPFPNYTLPAFAPLALYLMTASVLSWYLMTASFLSWLSFVLLLLRLNSSWYIN